jgi:protoporphyrinogen oxidase
MLYAKLGKGIVDKFLRPYNEKLYACSLDQLDKDAMGRFFPHADIADIIRNMRHPDTSGYNVTFTYAKGGAIEYIRALLHDLDGTRIHFGERLLSIDLERRIARTTRREINYGQLTSSVPLPRLMDLAAVDYDPALFTYNKVEVFNLGFDRKGWSRDHWVYIPDRDCCFYRVGFYDNIFASERMSLYIEIGMTADAEIDEQRSLARVLEDLQACGIVDGHELVSHHHAVLDPAYVHVHGEGQAVAGQRIAALAAAGVHSIGRYGGWKYCSIEDNILEARALVTALTDYTRPLS